MTAPKWTPGPWVVDESRGAAGTIVTKAKDDEGSEYLIRCPGSGGSMSLTDQVCQTKWIGTDEWKANAHLIAAAPEMYEALEALRYEFRGHPSKNIDLAKAALAKARGES